jgi:hypothetical protein
VGERPFDPGRILEVLHRHDVSFVVIGAVAAIAQGYPLPTEDIDVTPAGDPENLERLAGALAELGARMRLPGGGGLEFPIEAGFLAGNESWTLTTRFGPLDLLFMPAGTRGYDDLRRAAIELELGAPVLVAALADVIRSKQAAGRPKDNAQLPALRQTLEVIREREAREKG